MLRSKSRSRSFDSRQKNNTSILSRTISASIFCRGDPVLSQIDKKAVKPLDRKPLKDVNLPENQVVSVSTMQQLHMGGLQEELERTKEQLGATVEERDRAFDELREMKLVAQEANMKLSEALSSTKTEEIVTELNTVKESLSNSKQELKIKENDIVSLKLELENSKLFELKLAERDALLDKLQEELSNAKASEARLMGTLSENKKKIQELEIETERGKLSETKMFDTVASQTKQLEQTKVELEETKLEVVSLHEKMVKLEISSRQSSRDLNGFQNYENVGSTKEEKVTSSKSKSLLEEMNFLKNELKLSIEAEEKSNKAMDDLALALKEVATEANQAKEKLSLTEVELEHVKEEAVKLKVMVRSTEDRYQKLLDEATEETERYKNTVERLRLEAEESLLAWNDKEMGFVSCIKRAEEERTVAQQENLRLIESLKAAENMTRTSREENHKLRDILKQALNEANVAKEAAGIAKAENSQLKDCLAEKDDALDFLTRENERLRINEAAAHENIKGLKRLLSAGSTELKIEDKEEGMMLKLLNPRVVEREEGVKMNKAFSFDLHEILNEHEDEDVDHEIADVDSEKAEALKGSIFDSVETPKSEPRTPKSAFHQRSESSFTDDGETATNSEDFDNLDGTHFDDAENDRNSQRKRRALLRRFGDLIRIRSFHRKEPSME